MAEEPVHIIAGGRPGVPASAKPRRARRKRHKEHAPFLPPHGVARHALQGHAGGHAAAAHAGGHPAKHSTEPPA